MTTRQGNGDPSPHRIMVVFAHADDAEFTSGGSVAKWAAAGAELTYVVCTDGGKGTDSPEGDPVRIAETRRLEQLCAAETLGVRDVVFLGYPDGELDRADDLRERLLSLIRARRPERVVTWDPWRPYQLHRDHVAAGHAAFYAAVEAAIPDIAAGGRSRDGRPHVVDEVYLFGTDRADAWVDISEFVEKKRLAIRCHESQVKRGAAVEDQILASNETLGRQRGAACAEAFKVVRPHCEICR